MRSGLLAAAGWLLAAGVAVAVGTLAVSLVGTGITGGQAQPLSQGAVASALAQSLERTPTVSTTTSPSPESSPSQPSPPAPSTTAGSAPPTASTPAVAPVTRTLDSPGGGVSATCTGATVYLDSWTPRQGFETDDVARGPAATAYVAFDSVDGDGVDVDVAIGCEDGIPVLSVTTDAGDD